MPFEPYHGNCLKCHLNVTMANGSSAILELPWRFAKILPNHYCYPLPPTLLGLPTTTNTCSSSCLSNTMTSSTSASLQRPQPPPPPRPPPPPPPLPRAQRCLELELRRQD
eukprot:jgi/Botrbrau1/11026/Bobra.101_1s0024.1